MLTKVEAPRNYKRLINKQKETKDVLQIVDENGYLREVSFDDLTSHPTTIVGYGITDAYIQNGTIYLGGNSITPAAVSSLGTAAYKDYTTSIAQDNTNLPTSGAVYSAIAAAVSSALHFRGISSTALTDGGTETATIGGVALVPQDGDVVIYDGFEFLWESNQWNKLGDDTSYALKTIQITGDGTYITGGGDLTSSRTLDLSQAVKDALALASTAYQKPSGGIPASDLAEAYLPLTAGSSKALTGNLYFDATGTNRAIYWRNSSNVLSRFVVMRSDGQLYLGVDQITNGKATQIFGSNLYLNWNTSAATKQLLFSGTTIRATTTDIGLGNSSYPFASLYATTLYGNLDLSYLQNADDLKAIEALTGTGFAKRTADNTWALTNDIEATSLKTISESDASFTYRKTPNTAVGDTLKIRRILGKTVVWNQLAGDTALLNASYASAVKVGNTTTVTLDAAPGTGRWLSAVFSGYRAIAGHKYYMAFRGTITGTAYVRCNLGDGWFNYSAPTIVTVNTGATLNNNSFAVLNGSVGDTVVYQGDNPFVFIDLTQMFGSGLEPTLEQFESWYYKNYYAYDTGSLQSNRAASIETAGFNQWNEEWELGYYNNNTGVPTPSTTQIRSKNDKPISVFPNTDYFVHCAGSSGYVSQVFWYDANDNFISRTATGQNDKKVTSPTNAYLARFQCNSAYGTTYNHDICINLSDTTKNGTYEPYHKDTLTLNLTSLTSGGVAVCQEGLKAADYAGTVCDETDGQVLKNRVKRINLGDLDFIKSGDTYYVALTSAKAPASSYDVANMIPSKFSIVARNSQTTLSDEIALASNGNLFITPSTSYADADAFKAAMNGVYVDVELATPVDYVLDTPIPMLVASDVNGTQRRLPEDTESSVQAPFRADFQYGVNPDDIIQDLNTKLQDLDNRYLPANALSNVVDITGTGLLTMPRAAISDSLLVPTLCRQQQGDVVLEWYEAKASLYVKENDLTLHIVLNGNDYSLNLN